MRNSLKTLTPLLALTLALTISGGAIAMPDRAPAASGATTANPTVAVTGKVAETFDAGGYTYVAVEKEKQRMWVASRPIKVVIGQEVSFKPGLLMRNFTSGSLGRTFDIIVFTQGLATPPPQAAAPVPGK